MKPLSGKVALVTGASRGIGRGIALQLGQSGALVYITGRKPGTSLTSTFKELPSLQKTAEEISHRDAECIPVYCDHSNPDEVKALFDKIDRENNGKLDILVNNAYSAANEIGENASKKFYDLDPMFWDSVNNVGLRNNYICCTLAAKLMVPRKSGLIVNISSLGGAHYAFNVAYGVGKAAVDRLTTDMAFELEGTDVSIVTLYPGIVKTEMTEVFNESGAIKSMMNNMPQDQIDATLQNCESSEFCGKGIVALAADPKVNRKSGKIVFTSDLAREYKFKDTNGKLPTNSKSIATLLRLSGWPRLASFIPSCLNVPTFIFHIISYKFYKIL